MKLKLLLFVFTSIFFVSLANAQVKIGDNPAVINGSSILELESSDKVLVITRMTAAQMNAVAPLSGALVYNTDDKCVHVYDGAQWKSLCGTATTTNNVKVTTANVAPTTNNTGDFWVDTTKNDLVNLWDGTKWVSIDNNPKRGSGVPTPATVINPLAGDVYVDETSGVIYAYNGTTWVQSGANVNANNGLLIAANNTVQLGGVLIKPTVITTDATNTLAIKGLEQGDILQDDIVTVNRTTGELRKIQSSDMFREEVAVITANDDDVQFAPAIAISDSKKVNVYRNGVRIDFTVINNNTIEVEPEAKCYAGDQIRIVQFY